ncbi:hypothetical protein C8R43DRAFT_1210508 [Mycena crocata]|nr:hypothetical protein C8R43DRAFT_1210508 [Mycena crocata]
MPPKIDLSALPPLDQIKGASIGSWNNTQLLAVAIALEIPMTDINYDFCVHVLMLLYKELVDRRVAKKKTRASGRNFGRRQTAALGKAPSAAPVSSPVRRPDGYVTGEMRPEAFNTKGCVAAGGRSVRDGGTQNGTARAATTTRRRVEANEGMEGEGKGCDGGERAAAELCDAKSS